MGRFDDAREIVERLRAITPVVIPDVSYLRNPEHRELLLEGLRWRSARRHEPEPPPRRDPLCPLLRTFSPISEGFRASPFVWPAR
jgi:hypothetical protein